MELLHAGYAVGYVQEWMGGGRWGKARGGTPIETLYGDVPPKWVGF